MNFTAVILAGGKSSRMGRNKAFLEYEGAPLLARQVKTARAAGAQDVFISGRANTDYSAFCCPVLLDDFPDAGPLAGIERALDVCAIPMLLVLAVDMPHMMAPLLQELVAHCGEMVGVIPRLNSQIQPLTACYPKVSRRLILDLLSSRSNAVKRFAEKCAENRLADFIDFPLSKGPCFTNWNKLEDTPKN